MLLSNLPVSNMDEETKRLIEIARQSKDKVEPINEVEEFILEYPVEPSDTDQVEATAIYWRYLEWWKNRHAKYTKKKPIARRQFFGKFAKYFIWYNSLGGKRYGVVADKFELDTKEWFAMRKHLREEQEAFKRKRQNGRSKKEKNQKKSDKTSRS